MNNRQSGMTTYFAPVMATTLGENFFLLPQKVNPARLVLTTFQKAKGKQILFTTMASILIIKSRVAAHKVVIFFLELFDEMERKRANLTVGVNPFFYVIMMVMVSPKTVTIALIFSVIPEYGTSLDLL